LQAPPTHFFSPYLFRRITPGKVDNETGFSNHGFQLSGEIKKGEKVPRVGVVLREDPKVTNRTQKIECEVVDKVDYLNLKPSDFYIAEASSSTRSTTSPKAPKVK
jgi:hypothetical protein